MLLLAIAILGYRYGCSLEQKHQMSQNGFFGANCAALDTYAEAEEQVNKAIALGALCQMPTSYKTSLSRTLEDSSADFKVVTLT